MVCVGGGSGTGDDSMSPCILKKHSLPLRDSPRSTYVAFTAQKMKLEEKIPRGQNTSLLTSPSELGKGNPVCLDSSRSYRGNGDVFLPVWQAILRVHCICKYLENVSSSVALLALGKWFRSCIRKCILR